MIVKESGETTVQQGEGLYEALLQCVRGRRSIRSFQTRPVPEAAILRIMEAGRWAPSGANSQPWEFIVVKRRDSLDEIGRLFVEDRKQRLLEKVNFPGSAKSYLFQVPAMLVVVADPRWKQTYPGTDFTPELQDMYARNSDLIFAQSVAAAIENMFLAAAALGIGMAWLSGFAEERLGMALRRLLMIPEPLLLMAGLPIGYPQPVGQSRLRRPLEDFVHFETYAPDRLKKDEFFRDYCLRERNRLAYGASSEEK